MVLLNIIAIIYSLLANNISASPKELPSRLKPILINKTKMLALPRYKTRTPGLNLNDDDYFPFSPFLHRVLNSGAMPKIFAQNLTPPLQVIHRMYYPSASATTFFNGGQSILENVAGGGNQIHHAPRAYRVEDKYKMCTENDIEFACGLRDVHLNGMTVTEEYDNVKLSQAAMEKTVFDPNPFPVDRMPWEIPPAPTEEQNRARRLLHEFQETRVRWAGCPQEDDPYFRSLYCCNRVMKTAYRATPEARKTHLFNIQHSRAECPRNLTHHQMVNNMNINAPNADGQHGVHAFLITPVKQRDLEETKRHLYYLENFQQTNVRNHIDDKITSMDFGILEPDSSLQLSLELDKLKMAEQHHHQYLYQSSSYQAKLAEYEAALHAPPLTNPTQSYFIARWMRRQIDRNVWSNRGGQAIALPVIHPGKGFEKSHFSPISN